MNFFLGKYVDDHFFNFELQLLCPTNFPADGGPGLAAGANRGRRSEVRLLEGPEVGIRRRHHGPRRKPAPPAGPPP